MSFSVGIVGLPNVGKSTLFKALTKKNVEIADYPFTTIEPNIGTIAVPDERLEKIKKILKPEKALPTTIKVVDIAGLIKGAHQGEGLGNQFLAQIRNCDAIIEVVKCFGENPQPEKDIETIREELKMKDLQSKEKENLLSKKPVIYLFNVNEKNHFSPPSDEFFKTLFEKEEFQPKKIKKIIIDVKFEQELSELSEKEKEELQINSSLDQLIKDCYNILDLVTFYTIKGGKEVRAWTVPQHTTVDIAGGKVHSDFREKFIKAEVLKWEKFIEAGSWSKAKEKGWVNVVGRDYLVEDGDIIEFKI